MIDEEVLPTGWKTTTIGSVCEVNPQKPNLRGVGDETAVLFVPMAAVDEVSGSITAAHDRQLGEVRNKSYRTFTSGDVLFAKITPCMENGKAAVVPCIPSALGFGSTEFHVLRPSPDIDADYLWHFVRQESFRREAEQNMTGSVGQARVPKAFVEQHAIPLPSLTVQRELVAALDLVTTKGASAAAHIAAGRRALERFRQTILSAASSGRLTADWREDHPGQSGADVLERISELRKGRGVSRYPEEITAPAESDAPETWVWATFGSVIAELRNGVSVAPAVEPPGLPILRISSTRPLSVDLTDHRYLRSDLHQWEQFTLRDGDLLFTRYNGSLSLLGVCGLVRGLGQETLLYPDKLMRARFDHDLLLPEYVELFFASPAARNRMTSFSVSSAGQQGISGASLKGQPVAVPPIAEQEEIVRRGSRMLEIADRLLERLETVTRDVDRSSQSALAKAFRGALPDGIR